MSLWFPNWQQERWRRRLQVFEKKRPEHQSRGLTQANIRGYTFRPVYILGRFPQIWHYFEKYRSAFIFSYCFNGFLLWSWGTENNRDTYQHVNYIKVDVQLKYQPPSDELLSYCSTVRRKWLCLLNRYASESSVEIRRSLFTFSQH